MADYSPVKILEYVRDGLVEEEHYGFFVKVSIDNNSEAQSKLDLNLQSRLGFSTQQLEMDDALIAPHYNVFKLGDDKNYPFYLRSCAKPLQAALIVDFEIDTAFNMTSEEIAVCCSSHAGEECHAQVVKGFLDKIGLDENSMKCGIHKPLSKSEQNKLILSSREENILQNNCSGKHAMMLAICKKMGWEVMNYDLPEHPLQVAIKKKIYELCDIKFDYPVTKDGCGVPIYAMPLENMVKGYLNLFLGKKYSKIKEAFVNHPYLIGGEDRFDTAIMTAATKSNAELNLQSRLGFPAQQQESDNSSHLSPFTSYLIVKSGAGGICVVVNLEQKEGFVIKVMDSDMKARAICIIEALKQLGWLNEEMLENDLIKEQNKTDILTLHGEKIGFAKCTFCLK